METIDTLPATDLKILQDKDGFMYGVDAVLLSHFALECIRNENSVVDLGCGNGVMPLLLAAHSRAKQITGIEIQEKAAELARKNVELNGLSQKIQILQGNVSDIASICCCGGFDCSAGCEMPEVQTSTVGWGGVLQNDVPQKNSADVVISNPPYMKYDAASWSDKNSTEKLTAARHELYANLDDFVGAAAFLLKSKGRFCLIHRPNRLSEIFSALQKYRLEPKRMQLVFPAADRPPTMVLIEARKNAASDLKILEPLIMYSAPGQKSPQMEKIYSFGAAEALL